MMLRLKIELVDVRICHKADLPFAHGDVRLIALKRSWLIAQKLARFQRAALPLVGVRSHGLRPTIVGQGHRSCRLAEPSGSCALPPFGHQNPNLSKLRIGETNALLSDKKIGSAPDGGPVGGL